jgi:DNA gyrase, A subunit
MEANVFDKVNDIDLKKTMEKSYIDYAMSVIASRALPDIRDGLKPVQRRILYSMIELNNGPDKPHRKCARIVGDTMGKYHPHGDSSIYGALVNMAQDWSMRCPLVDGHGNFGSVDGDSAAAMRYTEARLSKIAMEMLADINKDTVDFVPNFDDTEKEPIILPARFPNLLVNGTTGIAVGMATNIPPHNLRETIDAIKLIIDNRIEQKETTIDDIVNIVKGPDFPTGAMILGKTGIREAYTTGRGKIKVRAISNIETLPNGKNRIIITELPYLVNKAKLIEKIAELVRDKKVDGITDLRDESNREGMRVVIELRRDVNPNIILNRLYKHTQLQDTFGVIMLSLVNNEPKILNIKQMLDYYLKHQEEVVTRRTLYDLNKAKERAHILEGLLKALDNIDEVIKIIRASENVAVARQSLMERFELSEAQSFAIVDMRLRALTGLEREKLEAEYAELMEKIKYYNEILSDNNKLLALIKEEISVVSEKYATDRKTIFGHDENMEDEDLIADEDTVVVMTNLGYIKRMSPDNFKSQNRGGKGIKGMQTIEDDFIEDIIITTTHKNIYFFTNMGRVYKIKAYKIPDASRIARGNAIINLLDLKPEEKISAIIAENNKKDLSYLFMATKHGIIKKLDINEVANIRRNGLKVINLLEDDELIEVKITSKDDDILLISKFGKCVRFSEKDLRNIGRNARGVKGAKLSKGDELIAMQTSSQGDELLTISEYGIGKRTNLSEYDTKHRNIQGVKCHNITEKTGNLIGAKLVDEDMDILIISSEGIIIRIGVKDISLSGRNTSGVKLIDINKENDVRVASIAKVRYKEEE